jgi:hypothetical protein
VALGYIVPEGAFAHRIIVSMVVSILSQSCVNISSFRSEWGQKMAQFAFGNEEDVYTRTQIEGEIHQHDLSLRKIDEKRLLLAVGLAENDSLQRLIVRRRREAWFTIDRTKSRDRAFRLIGGLRQRRATN